MLLLEAIFDRNSTCQRGLVADAVIDLLILSFSFVAIPSLMLLTISVLDSNGNCLVRRNSGPFTQIHDCNTSADIPASAGLPLEATWFHSSTLVF